MMVIQGKAISSREDPARGLPAPPGRYRRGFTVSFLGLSHIGIQFLVYEFLKQDARNRSCTDEESAIDLKDMLHDKNAQLFLIVFINLESSLDNNNNTLMMHIILVL